MPIREDGSYRPSGFENFAHVTRSFFNASTSVLLRPRDPMTKGYIDQYKATAGCIGNITGDPIIYTLWATSYLLTAPFKRK
jgi:hypothetical protein